MGKKILIVDDERGPRDSLTMILRPLGYIDIDTAEDGFEALKKLKEKRYDLITTCLRMPGMDGIEMISIIRREVDEKVPIVIISGYISKYVHRFVRQGLVQAIYAKPFSLQTIVTTVKLLIDDEFRKEYYWFNAILDLGRRQGYLTQEAINRMIPSDTATPKQIDDLMHIIRESIIKVLPDPIVSKEDLLKVIELFMPIYAKRFELILVKPEDKRYTQCPILEKDYGFSIVVRAVTWHERDETGSREVKDVREQEVFFIEKRVMPIKCSFLYNYLEALVSYISSQPFDVLEKYFPHVFFFSELLHDKSLMSCSDFLNRMISPDLHSKWFDNTSTVH